MNSWHTKKAEKILVDIFGKRNYDEVKGKIDEIKSNPSNNIINIPNVRVFINTHFVSKMDEKPANSSGFKANMKIKDIMFDEKGPIGRLYHSPGTRSSGNFSKLIYNPLIKNRPKNINIDDENFKKDCKKLTKKYLSLTSEGGDAKAYEDLVSADDQTDDNAPKNCQLNNATWHDLHRKKNKDIIDKLKSDRLSNRLKSIIALTIYHWSNPPSPKKPSAVPHLTDVVKIPKGIDPLMNEWIDILIGKTVKGKPFSDEEWPYKSGEEMRKSKFEPLEKNHNYIQVFFPIEEPSNYANKELYLNNLAFKKVWIKRKKEDKNIMSKIQQEMRLNFKKMLTFWGFSTDANITFIAPSVGAKATKRRTDKVCTGDHNNKRITRVLLALRIFKLDDLAKKFHDALKGLNHDAESFWDDAMNKSISNLHTLIFG